MLSPCFEVTVRAPGYGLLKVPFICAAYVCEIECSEYLLAAIAVCFAIECVLTASVRQIYFAFGRTVVDGRRKVALRTARADDDTWILPIDTTCSGVTSAVIVVSLLLSAFLLPHTLRTTTFVFLVRYINRNDHQHDAMRYVQVFGDFCKINGS